MITHMPTNESPNIHPDDVYTLSMHADNVEAVDRLVSIHGIITDQAAITPWLMGVGEYGTTLLRASATDNALGIDVVSARIKLEHDAPNPFMHYTDLIGSHFVKDTVKLEADALHASSKIYPRLRTALGIMFLNQPISAGFMMGYPTSDGEPQRLTKEICSAVYPINALRAASQANLPADSLYAQRPNLLKRWVKLDLT